MIIKIRNYSKNKDMLLFFFLLLVTIIFVYYVPSLINRLYFLILLLLFWRSKKNFFWFAFVFYLMLEPAGLFHGHLFSDEHRVPLYNIASGYSFHFFDLFILLAFLKALILGNKEKYLLKNPLILLLFYLFFSLLIGVTYGLNLDNFIYYARILSALSIFISFPYLVYKKEDVYKFIHLIMPIAFIILAGQIFDLFTGGALESVFLRPEAISMKSLGQLSGLELEDLLRPTRLRGTEVFFCLIFSLFFLAKKNYEGSKLYLYVISSISVFSAFLSATRAWIIIFVFFLVLYSVFVLERRVLILTRVLIVVIVLFLLSITVPRVRSSLIYSKARVATISSLLEGDLTASGTLIRITERLPKVVKKFHEKPIFGWGFSNTFRKWNDGHVGNFNMLMQCGIIGFMFFLNFWVCFYSTISKSRKKLSKSNVFKRPLLVLNIAFICMLILHFTSYQFFGFVLKHRHTFFLAFFISISIFFVKEANLVEGAIFTNIKTRENRYKMEKYTN